MTQQSAESWTIWRSFYCEKKKEIEGSFSHVCPVIDNEFHHNIVKVVCGSTKLSTYSTDLELS